MRMVAILVVACAIFLVGCQQKTEFEACIEFVREGLPDMAKDTPRDFVFLAVGLCQGGNKS